MKKAKNKPHTSLAFSGAVRDKKVIVAMSGGIDSSVAAALLKRADFDVIGVFMKFWREDSKSRENKCCSSESEGRARQVAKILKIPFYVFNFEKEFKKTVVDYFLKEYKEGRTPNPCVVCNKEIKFGILLKKALSLGADFVATGHYARIRKFVNSGQIRYSLMKAKDKNKDQSYFLWQLNQKQLKHILFPIGGYTKAEVRKLAKKFKLPVAGAKESQEVCFVRTSLGDFLEKYIKMKPGKIINAQGKVLGEHQGLPLYTIGQRKGIGLPGGPYFVLKKDEKRNMLTVTKNEKELYRQEFEIEKMNWIVGGSPKLPIKVKARIRYGQKLSLATISGRQFGKFLIKLEKPQKAIASGQSAVFYSADELIGGGIIV